MSAAWLSDTTEIARLRSLQTYYHTIELPDGLHEGDWDCRAVVDEYLGHADLTGKTVLEVGPANGFFTFAMEARGAGVTCLDLGQDHSWDLVPDPQADHETIREQSRIVLQQIENAWWHGHRLTGSRAEMRYGPIYAAGTAAPMAQVGLLGNVLQHLRDPFGGLMAMVGRITEQIIVTEALWTDDPQAETEHCMRFVPRCGSPVSQSWWLVSAPLICEWLKMLGFDIRSVHYHHPMYRGNPVWHVSVVGSRR